MKKTFKAYATISPTCMKPKKQWSIMFFNRKSNADKWLKHCISDAKVMKVKIEVNP